jgi:Uma2 family endonuclease
VIEMKDLAATPYRAGKMPAYARHGVKYLWLVDPAATTLEVFVLKGPRWTLHATHANDEMVRAVPFEAIELDLASLWDAGKDPTSDPGI